MGIVNRRNAVIGWMAWQAGKRVARRKARAAVPTVEEGRPNKGLIVSVAAAVGAAVFFWRRRSGPDAEAEE